MEFISGQMLTGFFVAITVIAFCIYKVSCANTLNNRRKMLAEMLKKMEEQHMAPQAVIEEAKKCKFAAMSRMWRQYERHLVKKGIEYRSTADAEEFFNADSLTEDLSMGMWNNLGSIFTGLGILGTFVGLCWGMKDLSFNNGAEATMQSLQVLLDGTTTAFITSIVGIAMALLFHWYHESNVMKKFSQTVNAFSEELDKAYPLVSVEQLLGDLLRENARQTASLRELREGISEDLQDTLESLQEDMGRAVAQALSSSVGNDFKPAIEQLTMTIKSLQEGGRKAIQKAIEKGAAQALQQFTGDIQQMSSDMQALLVNNTQAMRTSADALAQMVQRAETTNEQAKTMVDTMQQASKQLSVSVRQASDDMSDKLQHTGKQLLTSMNEAAQKLAEAAAPVQKSAALLHESQSSTAEFLSSLGVLSKQLTDAVEAMSNTEAAARQFYTQSTAGFDALGQRISNTSRELGDTIDIFNRNMRDGLKQNMEQYDQSISTTMQGLTSICERLNAATEKLIEAR